MAGVFGQGQQEPAALGVEAQPQAGGKTFHFLVDPSDQVGAKNGAGRGQQGLQKGAQVMHFLQGSGIVVVAQEGTGHLRQVALQAEMGRHLPGGIAARGQALARTLQAPPSTATCRCGLCQDRNAGQWGWAMTILDRKGGWWVGDRSCADVVGIKHINNS